MDAATPAEDGRRSGTLALALALALAFALGAGLGCAEDPDGAGAGPGGGGAGASGGAGGGAGAAGGGGTGGEAGSPATGDEALFLRILAGEVAAAEGFLEIARSDGWPIRSRAGHVFARLDEGRGPWRLAGDAVGWDGVAMSAASGFHWLEVPVASPDGSLYKFVDRAGTFEADPLARRYGHDSFGEHSLVAASAAHLERWPAVTDGVVEPRTVRVRVPSAPATRHLYVHDGQNLFDPAAPFGGWALDASLPAGVLAVGIDNTPARMDEYTHVPDDLDGTPIGGRGDAYADFVEDTVRPLVEQRYGVPAVVGVMGSSLGGLISFHGVLRHRGRYDFAASLSGTFGWGSIGARNETLIERFAAAAPMPTVLYLDSGGGPGSGCVDADGDGVEDDSPDAADNYCETRQLADVLAGTGYVWDDDLFHWWEADAAHNEAAWAARVSRPLAIFERL